ncbi:unnamed protein product [Orchesella dallaii]|uniref:Uncharacterized protein n=1 Tax=Orchesella dallaii TaxID=48710 RepID=A0ABP1QFC4_9HEXA
MYMYCMTSVHNSTNQVVFDSVWQRALSLVTFKLNSFLVNRNLTPHHLEVQADWVNNGEGETFWLLQIHKKTDWFYGFGLWRWLLVFRGFYLLIILKQDSRPRLK